MNASRKGLVEDCAQMTSDRKYALFRGISTDKRAWRESTAMSSKPTFGPAGLPLFNIQIALAESLGGRE